MYEIYKVGEDLGWKAGLNLLGPFGRSVAIVPHWNNHEGGEELDTSHSFMGQERFERLLACCRRTWTWSASTSTPR